jgi:hypothetical protein
MLLLTSGQKAAITRITSDEAIEVLSQPARRKTWFGENYKALHRVSRGPGPKVAIANYALTVSGKHRAIMRIGTGPYGNRPVISAVGQELARYTAYLSRLWGAGISSDELAAFIKEVTRLFPEEYQQRRPERGRYRYLLSLDDINGWLIENPNRQIFEAHPAAGRIYHTAGALYAGTSRSRTGPARYVDPTDGRVKSIYNNGRTMLPELRQQEGVQFISSGPKHRFVFILAEPGTALYQQYRLALPPHIKDFKWGENGLGVIQPRLFVKQAGDVYDLLKKTLSTLEVVPLNADFQV